MYLLELYIWGREQASTGTRFNLNFSRVFRKKKTPPKGFILLFFSQKKLARLFILKEVKLSPNGKMMKLHAFDNLFPPPTNDIRAKTRSRMTAAITFFRQNDAGLRVSNTQYWENFLLVVVLVSES